MHYTEVLEFWFGSVDCPKWDNKLHSLWLDKKMVTDKNCQQFLPLVSKAGEGELNDWLDEPLGMLAHLILLDQISRRVYRGLKSAYRYDQFALALCKKGLANEQDQRLMPIQKAFFYMPLLHSECPEDQEESCFRFKQLCQIAFPEQKKLFDIFYQLALNRFETIERFRRFPERNFILGRLSSDHELNWLKYNLAK